LCQRVQPLTRANGGTMMAQANGSLRNRFAKRHYEAIATAIQEARRLTDYNGHDNIGVQFAIAELSRMFARDNGRFNQDRFECACIPGANVRARS